MLTFPPQAGMLSVRFELRAPCFCSELCAITLFGPRFRLCSTCGDGGHSGLTGGGVVNEMLGLFGARKTTFGDLNRYDGAAEDSKLL